MRTQGREGGRLASLTAGRLLSLANDSRQHLLSLANDRPAVLTIRSRARCQVARVKLAIVAGMLTAEPVGASGVPDDAAFDRAPGSAGRGRGAAPVPLRSPGDGGRVSGIARFRRHAHMIVTPVTLRHDARHGQRSAVHVLIPARCREGHSIDRGAGPVLGGGMDRARGPVPAAAWRGKAAAGRLLPRT